MDNLKENELLKKANSRKSSSIINAFIIGFMIGIIIWSIFKNTVGLLTLIPLFIIYKMVNNGEKDKVLEE